jgi:pimeloyl-ACP methyl ester carboxylesterase
MATALVTAAAVVSAWLAPRGPITGAEALASLGLALVIGVGAGLATGTRWSILLSAAVIIIVFELARLGVNGPTVDGIHPDSLYGLMALVLGRGVHGLLVLAPMILGTLYGVELAARLGKGSAPMGPVGWLVTALLTTGLLALAVVVARPGTTAPIVGSDGEPVSGSIAELTTVRIGGHDQALMIRGRSIENPVLLHLAGGPGGTDIGAMRADAALEQDFVVVTWDQRGTGKSYSALDPTETLTPEQMVADTVELTTYLQDRFDENKIYLTGNSWGATLGVLAVQQRPELYHAFVGTGQMVSQRATDVMFWEDTLAWAERTGDADLAATLRKNGPPPYADLFKYELALSHEHDWNPYPEFDGRTEMDSTLFVPENTLMDQLHGFAAFLDTFSVLYPQLQEIDFRADVPSLDVPVYMVIGRYEARGRAVLADEWFDLLEAPSKERVVFEHSGHRPSFEEPAVFASLMTRVRGETYRAADEGSAAVMSVVVGRN